MEKSAGSYVISVSAGTGCYRHLRISVNAALEQLSEAILDAFQFCNDHAHAFFMDNKPWSDVDSYYMELPDEDEGERHTCDVTLRQLKLEAGKKFLYIFDFGDEWRFECKVLKAINEPTNEPVLISAKGKAPMQYDFDL